MQFGEDKCAYLQIEKGKAMKNFKPISMNGLTIKPIEEGDNYKYLGIDENISYNGPINKGRVTKEYINRIRKIWSSQLSDFNKAVAHNAFAGPTLTSTVGILDWTCKDIDQIDIKTRKTLAMSGSFHHNSDADRLCFCRKDGGRGIRAIRTMYESRIISIRQHLRNIKDKSDNNTVRVGYELLQRSEIEDEINEKPRTISKNFSTKGQNLKRKKYSNKKVYSYLHIKLQGDSKIDTNISNRRSANKSMTSQFEGYLASMHDQEIATKYLINKRQKEAGKEITCDTKHAVNSTEDINHIISSCPEMSVMYYLPIRHDVVAKTVLKAIILKIDPTDKFKHQQDLEFVYKVKGC